MWQDYTDETIVYWSDVTEWKTASTENARQEMIDKENAGHDNGEQSAGRENALHEHDTD